MGTTEAAAPSGEYAALGKPSSRHAIFRIVDGLIAIDIGNTSVKVAEYPASAGPLTAAEVQTVDWSDLSDWLADRGDLQVVAGSVVASSKAKLRALVASDRLLMLRPRDFPMTLDLTEPDRVGVDRVAAAYAAVRIAGGPCVVVDLGTAITIDGVCPKMFWGGLIAPGPQMVLDALSDRTDALPRLNWNAEVAGPPPSSFIGHNTTEAIAKASYGLMEAGIAELIGCVQAELGHAFSATPPVYRTGGAELQLKGIDAVTVPDLTLRGLAACGQRLLGGTAG